MDIAQMLQQIIGEKWLTARAVIGFFPANTVQDDDVALYTTPERKEVLHTLHFLRQQNQKGSGSPIFALPIS
jgi:5-methyltetrahydrofolate--homocysteine methyltransferase